MLGNAALFPNQHWNLPHCGHRMVATWVSAEQSVPEYKSKWFAYRPEIDGLRAIAVLSVVLYHADLGVSAGFVGVDVFFVISGYLITSLLYQEWAITGRIGLMAFYARRVRRIFPALIVVVLSTFVVSTMMLTPSFEEELELSRSAAASLMFVGNLFFQVNTGGYFDPSANHLPMLHLWSLSVEEQFYAIWPILLIAILRLRPMSRNALIVSLAVVSVLLAEVLILFNPNAAFYQMPARFWELVLGGVIALLPGGQQRDGRPEIITGTVLVLIAMAIPIDHFPGLGALPAVAGAVLVLHAVHISSTLGTVGAWLRSRPMVFFGLISYSLYLWHWPMLALYRASQVGPAPLSARALLAASAIVLAWLSYRFVECPWRRSDPRTTDSGLVASGLIMSASMAFLVMKVGVFFYQEPVRDDLVSRTSRDWPENRFACHYRGDEVFEVFPKPRCNSVPDKPVRVLIWGDSHALAWQPIAWAIAQREGLAATSYTRDACPPVLDYDNGKRWQEANHCRDFNVRVFNKVKIENIDTLILTALWPNDLMGSNFKEKFESTVRLLAPKVRRIVLLGPTPYLRDSAPRCIEAGNLDACAVTRSSFEVRSSALRQFLATLAAQYDNFEYLDLTDFFCDQETCPALKDGYALYWDTNHVSSTAARHFSARYLAR